MKSMTYRLMLKATRNNTKATFKLRNLAILTILVQTTKVNSRKQKMRVGRNGD